LGHEVIPKQFLRHCEASDEIAKLAENLHDASFPIEDRMNKASN